MALKKTSFKIKKIAVRRRNPTAIFNQMLIAILNQDVD